MNSTERYRYDHLLSFVHFKEGSLRIAVTISASRHLTVWYALFTEQLASTINTAVSNKDPKQYITDIETEICTYIPC